MTFNDWLYIIKSDRKAWIGLFVVITVGAFALFLGKNSGDATMANDDEYDSLRQEWGERSSNNGEKYYAVAERQTKLQAFDPNTADSTVLLGLGLQPWQVRSIYKYRANGGVYTCPEDFARLYGLSVKKYRELKPYIRIGDDYRPASEVVRQHGRAAYSSGNQGNGNSAVAHGENGSSSSTQDYVQKLKVGETMALNTADTMALRKVPGIGPFFARKIARYRESLGGFVSNEQLLEIPDFPESALPYLNVTAADAAHVKKLNINKATAEQLRKHPYINYMMAKQIMDYRRLRGNINSLSDLRLLPLFTDEVVEKLRPYVVF